jgi:3-methylfumaryl-CoA hydratase
MPDQTVDLAAWIGKTVTHHDRIRAQPIDALAATLDRTGSGIADGDPMPPLRHWLHFLEFTPASRIGSDGHPKRGGFLPPVALPLRMWAAGALTFQAPVPVGAETSLTSTIESVSEKAGKTGPLVFVTVRHVLATVDGPAVAEEQTIVYRDREPGQPAVPATGKRPEETAEVSEEVLPDPVMLFRYSALTFNGHRIHYDIDFCREEEGYPGLVVHGPLLATLLADLAVASVPDRALASYRFRAVRPLFHGRPVRCEGRRDGDAMRLWTVDADGFVTMQAEARFAG